MKRAPIVVCMLLLASMLGSSTKVFAQDEESSSPFSVGGDLVSSYLWRGTKFGTGPAIQPCLEFSMGNFSIGAWGSYCFTTNEAAEADLYLYYGFEFGLSIGLTDYYFPGTEYFETDELYIFTSKREESYLIPIEADGALELWNEIIERELFNARLAIEVATGSKGLECWPEEK